MWLTHGEYSQSPRQPGNEGKVENRTGNQGKNKNCTGTVYTFSEPLILPSTNPKYKMRKYWTNTSFVHDKNTKLLWVWVHLVQTPIPEGQKMFALFHFIFEFSLGTIQVLRHYDFDPPTLSSDIIISYTHLKHDVIVSSYMPTYL